MALQQMPVARLMLVESHQADNCTTAARLHLGSALPRQKAMQGQSPRENAMRHSSRNSSFRSASMFILLTLGQADPRGRRRCPDAWPCCMQGCHLDTRPAFRHACMLQ